MGSNVKVAGGLHVHVDGGTRLVTTECHANAHGDCRGRVKRESLRSIDTLPCECGCHVLMIQHMAAAAAPEPGCIRIVVDAPTELLTMNTARSRIHWTKWAELTKAWRDATAKRCEVLSIPPVTGLVTIDGRPHQFGGNIADAGAHMPCVKACIDGLRDANVLEDDSPEFVAWVRCWAPVKSRGAGMVLELRPMF